MEFVEVHIMALDHSGGPGPIWPSEMSPVSGVILCYDATRSKTLTGLSEALGEFFSSCSPHALVVRIGPSQSVRGCRALTTSAAELCPGVPTILLACKSDPDKTLEVSAHVGDQIGQPHNVGLIEVTTATSQGKHKMHTGLRWLLYRLEEKQREWACAGSVPDRQEEARTPKSETARGRRAMRHGAGARCRMTTTRARTVSAG